MAFGLVPLEKRLKENIKNYNTRLLKKEFNALFTLKPPVEFPSAIYIPVTNMVTANNLDAK